MNYWIVWALNASRPRSREHNWDGLSMLSGRKRLIGWTNAQAWMWPVWWAEVLWGKHGGVVSRGTLKAMDMKEETTQDCCAWRKITGGRSALARMLYIPSVFGVTDVKRIWWWWIPQSWKTWMLPPEFCSYVVCVHAEILLLTLWEPPSWIIFYFRLHLTIQKIAPLNSWTCKIWVDGWHCAAFVHTIWVIGLWKFKKKLAFGAAILDFWVTI